MTAAIAAMWLTACGGGGGDGTVAAAPSPAPAPAAGGGNVNPPAPAPAPVAALGTSFTASTLAADVWHSLSSSDDGQVIVAGQAGLDQSAATPPGVDENSTSFLSISTDGGATWTTNPPAGTAQGIWIGSDVSADGNRIAAVQFLGNMFISVDRGANFTQVTLPPLPAAVTQDGIQFEGVTLTADGTRIAAVIMNGPVLVGDVAADGSVTWITPTGLPVSGSWRAIDSSATGNVMVAVGQTPEAFISTNGGASWAPLTVTTASGTVSDQNWYRVKVSADGSTIAMAGNAFGGNSGNGIYVSHDGGANFVVGAGTALGDYSAITMSGDGQVIAATVSNANDASSTGQVLLSKDGGATFAPLPVTVGGAAVAETDWRAITMSTNADRLAVAAGRFINNGKGQIYVSSGSRPQ